VILPLATVACTEHPAADVDRRALSGVGDNVLEQGVRLDPRLAGRPHAALLGDMPPCLVNGSRRRLPASHRQNRDARSRRAG
jgi:hypothetical protein